MPGRIPGLVLYLAVVGVTKSLAIIKAEKGPREKDIRDCYLANQRNIIVADRIKHSR